MIVAVVGGPCTGKTHIADRVRGGVRLLALPWSDTIPREERPDGVAVTVDLPQDIAVLSMDPLVANHGWSEQSEAAARVMYVCADVRMPALFEGLCVVRAVRKLIAQYPGMRPVDTLILTPPLTEAQALATMERRGERLDAAKAARYIANDKQVRSILQNIVPDLVRLGVRIVTMGLTRGE